MKHLKLMLLATLFLCFQQKIEGFSVWNYLTPNRFEIGPEIYHMERKKEGGSGQSGWLYGGRIRIEHQCPWNIYWAFDAFRASGKAAGHAASGSKIRSKFRDGQLEGRLGYTFQFNLCKPLKLTPYGGYGAFYGRNYFIHPSKIHCHFHNRFQYFAGGILATYDITSCLNFGVNFKAKFMQNGVSKIKKDPKYDNITLGMQDEWQYEVDLPIRYLWCCKEQNVEASFEPFYRFRHYGGMPNHPFDFVETKFHLYGARLLLRLFF